MSHFYRQRSYSFNETDEMLTEIKKEMSNFLTKEEAEIILNHYKISEPLPPSFSKARLLALHNQYSIVEVYNDKFILIDSDGNTTNIKN